MPTKVKLCHPNLSQLMPGRSCSFFLVGWALLLQNYWHNRNFRAWHVPIFMSRLGAQLLLGWLPENVLQNLEQLRICFAYFMYWLLEGVIGLACRLGSVQQKAKFTT